MTPAARLANAVARMDPDQLWALRVTVATERRLRTHYQPPTYPDGLLDYSQGGPVKLAHEWALENVK